MEYSSSSLADTQIIANSIATTLHGGDVVLLSGEMGSGKTSLSKGIAQALGITDEVTSPTFALMNTYTLPEPKNGIKTLIHIDTYRFKTAQEFIDIGALDYLGDPETLCLIEWPEHIQDVLPKGKYMLIKIQADDQNKRKIIRENS